jgi:hypothetical protein
MYIQPRNAMLAVALTQAVLGAIARRVAKVRAGRAPA